MISTCIYIQLCVIKGRSVIFFNKLFYFPAKAVKPQENKTKNLWMTFREGKKKKEHELSNRTNLVGFKY